MEVSVSYTHLFAMCCVDNMQTKDILKLEETFKGIKGVNKVISANDLIGTTIPMEMLPDELLDSFKNCLLYTSLKTIIYVYIREE